MAMSTLRQPALFISHGAPTLALEHGSTARFLRELGASLPPPAAILCVSAHWETSAVSLSANPYPQTIHDFGGFPAPLYDLEYPARGDAQLAARAAVLLKPLDGVVQVDARRGFDHGVWVPLMLMFPDAQIPVVSMAVQPHLPAAHHYRLGELLAPLRDEGVMILGSGGATHDLRAFWGQRREATPQGYAQVFDDWLVARVEAGDTAALVAYEQQGPEAKRNHPTPEHLLPLFVPLGAAHGGRGRVLHRVIEYGVLVMTAFSWE